MPVLGIPPLPLQLQIRSTSAYCQGDVVHHDPRGPQWQEHEEAGDTVLRKEGEAGCLLLSSFLLLFSLEPQCTDVHILDQFSLFS